MGNADDATVDGFGDEWRRFDFAGHDAGELDAIFDKYFSIFPWAELRENARGSDAGCGTGRWAERVLPRVGELHLIDASKEALDVAREKLKGSARCTFHNSAIDSAPVPDASMDFGYSLGVLHHLPDPDAGLRACVRKLKPGAPFLMYFYYALDNKPLYFRAIWRASDVVRRAVSELPHGARYATSQLLAGGLYLPLAKASKLLETAGLDVSNIPLSSYRNRSWYVMRNDALDRFGTRLEHRRSRTQLETMMRSAGLGDIRFREGEPYWCAVGKRL